MNDEDLYEDLVSIRDRAYDMASGCTEGSDRHGRLMRVAAALEQAIGEADT